MKSRCRNPAATSYRNYGARGITYDPQWEAFPQFLADMGEAPAGMQLDRIDNSGHYYKENCRWSTVKENCRNKRNNKLFTYQGETLTIAEWAERSGIGRATIAWRIKHGFTTEDVLNVPVKTRWRKHSEISRAA